MHSLRLLLSLLLTFRRALFFPHPFSVGTTGRISMADFIPLAKMRLCAVWTHRLNQILIQYFRCGPKPKCGLAAVFEIHRNATTSVCTFNSDITAIVPL